MTYDHKYGDKVRGSKCIAHHSACDCREEAIKNLLKHIDLDPFTRAISEISTDEIRTWRKKLHKLVDRVRTG